MSEWMEEQQQIADQQRVELEATQRRLWPPENVYVECCPLWLADGPALGGRGGSGVGKQQRGCNGGCSKDHPRVTLTYADDDAQSGLAMAIVSHDLKPFTDFFDDLCSNNRAELLESLPQRRYRLEGFLRCHVQALEACPTIPSHLIRVSPASLAASQRAEQRYVVRQEEARADCERKRPATISKDVLERVLDVCYFGLLEHLDVASIAWMRLSGSPPMVKYAARMAQARMGQLSLSYHVMNSGGMQDWPASAQGVASIWTHQIKSRLALYRQDEAKTWIPVESSQFPLSTDRQILQLYLEPSPSAPEALFHEDRMVACGGCAEEKASSDRFFLSIPPVSTEQIPRGPLQDPPAGFFTVKAIHWSFGDLLGLYARLALPGAKSHLQSIKSKRPASLTEMNYVKALAREARFASGDIRRCTESNS